MKRTRGVTAVELVTVIAILGVLAALAGPSFVTMIRSTKVSSLVNTFMADMRFARSEAIRRGGAIIMCRSDAPEAASPTCGTGSGPGGNGWVSGWLIFEDRNNSNSFNSGDQLLRVQPAITTIDSFVENGGSSSTLFRFAPTGRLVGLSAPVRLTVGSAAYASEQKRLCVGHSGRVRVLARDEDSANCTVSPNS